MTMTQIQLRAEATDCRSRGGVPEHASPTTTTTGRRHPDVALAQRDGSGRAATPCRVSEAWWSRRRSGSLRVSVGPAVLVVPSALTTGLTRVVGAPCGARFCPASNLRVHRGGRPACAASRDNTGAWTGLESSLGRRAVGRVRGPRPTTGRRPRAPGGGAHKPVPRTPGAAPC